MDMDWKYKIPYEGKAEELQGETLVLKSEADGEINRLTKLHCDACKKSTAGAGFPIGPCSPNCEWFQED